MGGQVTLQLDRNNLKQVVLAVLHSLPIAYVLGAAAGREPTSRMEMLPYADVRVLQAEDVGAAVARLERWFATFATSPER